MKRQVTCRAVSVFALMVMWSATACTAAPPPVSKQAGYFEKLRKSEWGFVYSRGKITIEKAIDSPMSLGQVKPGAKLPPLALKTDEGDAFDLRAYLSVKPTVLVAFRNAWCGHCTWQVSEMVRIAPALERMGFQMLGVSSAPPNSSRTILGRLESRYPDDEGVQQCLARHMLSFPLIADYERTLGVALGITVLESNRRNYGSGSWPPDTDVEASPQYKWYPGRNDLSGYYVPSVFVFGVDGHVRYEFAHTDHKVRVSGATLLAMARHVLDAEKTVCRSIKKARLDPPAVRKLDLSYQGLTDVPADIAQFTHLEDLRLNGNQLTAVPATIGALAKLKRLELGDNRLAALPPEIGRLGQLEDLQLWRNRLTQFPAEIGNLVNLKRLNAMENPIEELPGEIGRLQNLLYLRLFRHRLKELPATIGNLAHLRHLFLVGTVQKDGSIIGLETLPPEIGRLTELVELHLLQNQLKALPPQIGNLAALRILHLGENRLESLPPQIGKLQGVGTFPSEGLYLAGNRLRKLPPEIGQMKFIHLDVRRNLLEELPPELGRIPSTWGGMWFGHNRIRVIPPEIGNLKVARLRLNNNQLTAVPPELGNLKGDFLDLSHNHIAALPPELGGLTRLTLDASHNRITRLPDALSGLKGARFAGNAIPIAEQRRFLDQLDPPKRKGFRFR
jgi:Leucine-rich repeat (LRR) protein/peroxiredoxin